MSRNSLALHCELNNLIAANEREILIEQGKIDWVKNHNRYGDCETWEDVEEASMIVQDLQSRINALQGRMEEAKEVRAKLNAFYAEEMID